MYDFFDGFLDYISGLTCGCEFDPYSSSMNDVKDTVRTMAEVSYQHDHKKVRDRYGTTKFYGNNIKHKKRRK